VLEIGIAGEKGIIDALVNTSTLAWLYTGDVKERENKKRMYGVQFTVAPLGSCDRTVDEPRIFDVGNWRPSL
jgi:hypothetical protein